jgi:type IV secretory pathway ATPase VirB11/archaellum biosynthesis ATPase
LVDPFIEEIFLDSEQDKIYLNHQKFGKCSTDIRLNSDEIAALKTHIKLESKKRLDEEISSLIHVINNKYFNCRFSIDLYPSHWKNLSFDIRKMNKKLLTLFDLIRFETLNPIVASFLILSYLLRINITIAGEVNSGKTTLLNAIDMLAPKEFRRIYVEETIETIEIQEGFGHQLKYIVQPEILNENNKEKEIYKLLHRSGDIIILGEILSKLETKALFHCLSAGLKGLQTTHASSIESLLNRWIIHFNIEKSCLNDTGLIIIMKKVGNKRIIFSISQVSFDLETDKIKISTFFQYKPQGNWGIVDKLSTSKLFHDIRNLIKIDIDHALSILNSYFITNLTNEGHILENFIQVYWKLKNDVPEIGGV